MAGEILQVVLTPTDVDKYRIAWRYAPSFQAPGPLQVVVEWSREDENWVQAASAVDPPDYIDFSLPVDEAQARGYFLARNLRLSVTDAASATYVHEQPFAPIEHREQAILLDLMRRERQLMRYSGTRGWLLRRLYRGTRCSCYSSRYGGNVSTNCTSCYGTGFEGGFHPPVSWDIILLTTQTHRLQTADPARAAADVVTYRARGVYELPVYYGDVWVAGDGRRFHVAAVRTAAEFRSWPVALDLELRLIPPQDVIYQYTPPP